MADRPPCVGEWQEMLSLAHPGAEHPLVAQTQDVDLFVCAKDLFVGATRAGWQVFCASTVTAVCSRA